VNEISSIQHIELNDFHWLLFFWMQLHRIMISYDSVISGFFFFPEMKVTRTIQSSVCAVKVLGASCNMNMGPSVVP